MAADEVDPVVKVPVVKVPVAQAVAKVLLDPPPRLHLASAQVVKRSLPSLTVWEVVLLLRYQPVSYSQGASQVAAQETKSLAQGTL